MTNIKKDFKELYSFVDRAEKSRKYPKETAKSLRSALRLYELDLNEEEKSSVEKFKENFKQITSSVFNSNANKFNASSLAAYKSRALKVLLDFEKYGDPQKMNSWNPKVIIRTKKKKLENGSGENSDNRPVLNSQSGFYSYKDSGDRWEIVIKSAKPISIEVKKEVIEISALLDKDNRLEE